jgi:16S rRNA (guanine527-N7)-methyltransferase
MVLKKSRDVKKIKGQVLLDVGSGAGVPGLVLAIVCDGLEVLLTEVRQKKLAFLKRAVIDLKIHSRVRVVNPELESTKEVADTATLRAVTDLSGSFELGRYVIKPKGRIIMARGSKDLEPALGMGMQVEAYPWGAKGARRIIAIYDQ